MPDPTPTPPPGAEQMLVVPFNYGFVPASTTHVVMLLEVPVVGMRLQLVMSKDEARTFATRAREAAGGIVLADGGVLPGSNGQG